MDQQPDSANIRSGKYLPLLVILFFGSGCAALIYEVIWLQMLQLVIGLTSLSLGVLLGTFMGGMCLGSLLLPRLISVKRHPLRVYALLELGIGLSGIAILFGMPLIENIYTGITGYGLFTSILMRSLISAICLLPPTILMGATLPAISRWVETTPGGVSWMGFFYGGNIFGAVAGCLLAGFYLLRLFDAATATWVALSMNIIVAVGALLLARITSYSYIQPVGASNEKYSHKPTVVYITIALSGMAALGSEVIFTRLLSVMLGSTVYTFSIILSIFLVGLGIGSGAGAFLGGKIKNPGFALALCQFLLILSLTWTSFVITYSLPHRPLDMNSFSNVWYMLRSDLTTSAIAVMPSAIFWGASFPLALAAVARPGLDPGRMVGRVYASNTVGAIIGSLAFSMIGIPVLGTSVSQKLLVVISAIAAIIMFSGVLSSLRSPVTYSNKKIRTHFIFRFSGVTAIIVFFAVLVISKIHTVPWFSIAYGRYKSNSGYLQSLSKIPLEQPAVAITPIYVGEGLNGSVAVTQLSNGVKQFHSTGKVQASTDPQDMRLQRMLGHISCLLTENPESVLVVGCGAGITAGTFITYPAVRKIVICDIESIVPKVIAPMFSKENYAIADGINKENPHIVNGKVVRFEYDDGRHYISTSGQKFDIISADPIDPWAKGAAALYSEEYFKICKAHLKPGGAMSLWVPLYETSLNSVRSVISTFFKVFPNGTIWSNDYNGMGYDIVLFGQNEPTHIDIGKLEERLSGEDHKLARESLADVGFYNLEDLLATYEGCAADLKGWMAGAQINTDRNLRLSYLSGMSINYNQATEILQGICEFYKSPKNLFSGSYQKVDSLLLTIENKIMWNQGNPF